MHEHAKEYTYIPTCKYMCKPRQKHTLSVYCTFLICSTVCTLFLYIASQVGCFQDIQTLELLTTIMT